ncbi:MAG TPA: hypothetical protein VF258_08965 [Luteolibacter sp.]
MKILSATILAMATLASGETLMPAWNGTERADFEAAGWIAGAALLTDDPASDGTAPVPLQVESPNPEEIAADLAPATLIPEKFLTAYFAERPKTFLIDPQNLLSPTDSRDCLKFLNDHANDSPIDLFVYVIGGDQEIPGEVREEELIERFFSEGRPAALVYYYLGAPQRSVIHLSPSLTDSISTTEQNRALESAVIQSLEKSQPPEQLEKFLTQMSIRIYWMERLLAKGPATAALKPSPTAVTHDRAAEKSARLVFLQELARRFAPSAAILLGIFVLALGLGRWLRRRSRYCFPELEVEPRLGGAHAAGVGAVISFASAALPPASQRDQVPDYLRRA